VRNQSTTNPSEEAAGEAVTQQGVVLDDQDAQACTSTAARN